jgi:hypothetical protein
MLIYSFASDNSWHNDVVPWDRIADESVHVKQFGDISIDEVN